MISSSKSTENPEAGIHLQIALSPLPWLPMSRMEISRLVNEIVSFLGLSGTTIEIRLVSDSEIAQLNEGYLGLTGPTNVLSFPMDEKGLLGMVVISLEAVWREAYLYEQDVSLHFVRLLSHGLLHLSGCDHGTEMEAATEAAVERARSCSLCP